MVIEDNLAKKEKRNSVQNVEYMLKNLQLLFGNTKRCVFHISQLQEGNGILLSVVLPAEEAAVEGRLLR